MLITCEKNYETNNLIFFYKNSTPFFSGVRPKVYSLEIVPWDDWKSLQGRDDICIKTLKKKSMKRLKGVKSHLVHSYFTHNCYVKSILTGKPRYVRYFTIASRGHVVTTDYKGKLGLSGKQNTIVIQRSTLFLKIYFFIFLAFYDKRLIENCLVHTTPIGFYMTEEENYSCYRCKNDGVYVDKCETDILL